MDEYLLIDIYHIFFYTMPILGIHINMNDPEIFSSFLENVVQINTLCTRNAIIEFIDTFNALLSTNEDELDTFVTTTWC
jgi:hypothetical protein